MPAENKDRYGISSIAFDAYGTLFDLASLSNRCDQIYKGKGAKVSSDWRRNQLERTWLLTMMGLYVDFEVITKKALETTLARLGLKFDSSGIQHLVDGYLCLEPFGDTVDSLRTLSSAAPLCILSNGSQGMLEQVLAHAGLTSVFQAVVSSSAARCYKPDPRVYRLAVSRMRIPSKKNLLFVSANEWDVAGAKSFGLRVAWLRREKGRFAWPELEPDHTVTSIRGLLDIMEG